MPKRVAFFSDIAEIERFFNMNLNGQKIREPHHNLPPGSDLPVFLRRNNELSLESHQWGSDPESATLTAEQANEALSKTNSQLCIALISGFYIWKEGKENDHPFFVRMLNSPVMAVASILDGTSFRMILTESNALVQPMTPNMPMLLDRELAAEWVSPEPDAAALMDKAKNHFLLTDLSVVRVSKKVNDLSNNHASLIQPIPK
jgi:putative SOS response-associated peptidase YedK